MTLDGTDGDDNLAGSDDGIDFIKARGGSDTVHGLHGADFIDGGDGDDRL